MAKTKIKSWFNRWVIKNSVDIQRFAVVGVWVNANVVDFRITTYDTGNNKLLYTGTDLVDALKWADQYILDNFEVEKPIEERLKEAEAEIVTLKAKVTELEKGDDCDDGYKFKVGDRLWRKDWPSLGSQIVIGRLTSDHKYYTFGFNNWHREDGLGMCP